MSIPVSLVTGFLGAGKSTLINRLMKEHPNRRFGVVVNEFGNGEFPEYSNSSGNAPLLGGMTAGNRRATAPTWRTSGGFTSSEYNGDLKACAV